MNFVRANPDDRNWHVLAYLTFHRSQAYAARAAKDGIESAKRYDAAIAAAPIRIAEINAGQTQIIEPVRFGRDVERRAWVDPVQDNEFARTRQMVHGFRRVDALVRLEKGGTISRIHLAAGIRLRDDYEIGQGVVVGRDQIVTVASGCNPGGLTDSQLDAMARFRDAVQAVGKSLSGILIHVAVENRTVKAWAEDRARSVTSATGYFVAAMDALADHYGDTITHGQLLRAKHA